MACTGTTLTHRLSMLDILPFLTKSHTLKRSSALALSLLTLKMAVAGPHKSL